MNFATSFESSRAIIKTITLKSNIFMYWLLIETSVIYVLQQLLRGKKEAPQPNSTFNFIGVVLAKGPAMEKSRNRGTYRSMVSTYNTAPEYSLKYSQTTGNSKSSARHHSYIFSNFPWISFASICVAVPWMQKVVVPKGTQCIDWRIWFLFLSLFFFFLSPEL